MEVIEPKRLDGPSGATRSVSRIRL